MRVNIKEYGLVLNGPPQLDRNMRIAVIGWHDEKPENVDDKIERKKRPKISEAKLLEGAGLCHVFHSVNAVIQNSQLPGPIMSACAFYSGS
eukprot:scaffold137350_cov21-Tisochrysis_lutea.AAC.1